MKNRKECGGIRAIVAVFMFCSALWAFSVACVQAEAGDFGFGKDLDDYFDENKEQLEEAEQQQEAYAGISPEAHIRQLMPQRSESAKPDKNLEMLREEVQIHTDACGVCRHTRMIYRTYMRIRVTDQDSLSCNDEGAFNNMGSFTKAVASPAWKDATNVQGVYFACYGYGPPNCLKLAEAHGCNAQILRHVDERWDLIQITDQSGGTRFQQTEEEEGTTSASGSVEGSAEAGAEGGMKGTRSEKAKRGEDGHGVSSALGAAGVKAGASASAEAGAEGKAGGSYEGRSKTSSQSWGQGEWKFAWEFAGTLPPGEDWQWCECGVPKTPTGSGAGTTQTPPAAVPPLMHSFREPVRPGTPEEIAMFSATVSVQPERKFTIPAALRAKDGTLVAVEEVWVQPDGEEPKPLAKTGDLFAGTTSPKPMKVLAVVGGTAVAIIGLVPDGGDAARGVSMGRVPTSPAASGASAGVSAGTPPVTPPPHIAPPADFPSRAPVVNLASETAPKGSTPSSAPAPDVGGEAPSASPSAGEPPVSPSPAVADPAGGESYVRTAENQSTLIDTTGAFVPEEIPAMSAELAFPDAHTRSAGDIVFSTEENALVRATSTDGTGLLDLQVTDAGGHVQSGSAQAWTANLSLSEEVLKEGEALAIRIVTQGLPGDQIVKYAIELTPDAEAISPEAVDQTWSGTATIDELHAMIFRARFPTSGPKPMKLFLDPVLSER